MNDRYVFINDRFVRQEEASLPVSDLSIQRGYGLFDFFKVIGSVPLYLEDHLDRLYYSAGQMRLSLPPKEELKDVLHQLMEFNRMPHSGIRITLTGGTSTDGYSLTTPNLVLTQNPLILTTQEGFEKGIKLVTYEHQRQLPHIKSIDYLMAIWLQPLVKDSGADDVLYYKDGAVGECPRSNLFAVKEGVLITPAENILKGVIRKQVLQLAQGVLPVEERTVTLGELKEAAEVFVTSTTKQILPVRQIDDVVLFSDQPGKMTRELYYLLLKQQEHMLQSAAPIL